MQDIISSINSSLKDLDNSQYAQDILCTSNNCLPPNICAEKNTICLCATNYANFFNFKSNKDLYCSYKRKSQIIAFILELTLIGGFGHLYSGRTEVGLIKMIIVFILPVSILCLSTNDKSENTYIHILSCIICCTIMIWQTVDIVLFAINSYKDGNGISMISW